MMKRVVVLAGALTLAACGSGTNNGETAAPASSAAPAQVPAELVGTYGADGADGRPWTTTMRADGTYRNTVDGDLTESGTWDKTGDAICFTATPIAGADPVRTCQTLVKINDDGSLVVRDEGGQETTAPRLRPQ